MKSFVVGCSRDSIKTISVCREQTATSFPVPPKYPGYIGVEFHLSRGGIVIFCRGGGGGGGGGGARPLSPPYSTPMLCCIC